MEVTPQQLLELPLGENDSGESTIRGYLIRLLADVWTEQEGFDGKRPFGNSSWAYDLYVPLIRAGVVEGTFDGDGDLDDFSRESQQKADALILEAIKSLGAPSVT